MVIKLYRIKHVKSGLENKIVVISKSMTNRTLWSLGCRKIKRHRQHVSKLVKVKLEIFDLGIFKGRNVTRISNFLCAKKYTVFRKQL